MKKDRMLKNLEILAIRGSCTALDCNDCIFDRVCNHMVGNIQLSIARRIFPQKKKKR